MRLSSALGLLTCASMIGFAGCGEDDDPYDGRWDVVVAVCAKPLASLDSTCQRLESSNADVAYAHALFGKASGHSVGIRVEAVMGHDFEVGYHDRVPSNQRLLERVELRRSVCSSFPCVFRIVAEVDGARVADERFAFH